MLMSLFQRKYSYLIPLLLVICCGDVTAGSVLFGIETTRLQDDSTTSVADATSSVLEATLYIAVAGMKYSGTGEVHNVVMIKLEPH